MADEVLTRSKLQTAEAVLSLGVVVVKQLEERGIATVFLNLKGEVELCPDGELQLDTIPQDDAIATLLDKGYTDEQLVAYLKGRLARETRNGQNL